MFHISNATNEIGPINHNSIITSSPEAYTEITLANLMEISRTAFQGAIDVISAEHQIPMSCLAIFQHHSLCSAPPLCKEEYEKLSLNKEQLAELKSSNYKMQSLNVDSLILMSKMEIAQQILLNFKECMQFIYNRARAPQLNNPNDMRQFIEEIAIVMGQKIINPSKWLRYYDSDKFKSYTLVKDLNTALDDFCIQFVYKLNELLSLKAKDERLNVAKIFSAWIEYRFNLTDHFLSDGCGKTAAILTSFVYIVAGALPKEMPTMNRGAYFNNLMVPRTRRGSDVDIEKKELERWIKHYCTAFFPTPAPRTLSLHLMKDLFHPGHKEPSCKELSLLLERKAVRF